MSKAAWYLGEVQSEHGLFLSGVALAGWFFGRGPALAATVVASLISGGFFASPTQFLLGERPEQNLSLMLLIVEGCLFSLISSRLHEMEWPTLSQTGANAEKVETGDSTALSAIDYKRIVESVTACTILLVDTQGRVASWTAAGECMTGFSPEEIIEMPLSMLDVDAENAKGTFHRALEVARNGGNGTLQTRCVRKEGTEFWADIVFGAVWNDQGDLCGYSVVLRDITTKQQADELLEQRSRQLIEACRVKDEFLATVSHELRTPLNSILGWTQLFRAGKLDDAGRSHALETIEQSAKTQARLIEDLLDVSRIVSGKMRLEVRSLQMSEVIEAAVETIRPAAEAKSISIQLMLESVGCPVFGDPNRLQQVVWNLLSNAIKFTQPGGLVQVLLHRHGSSAQLLVKDNGIGIHGDFLPHIFDAFRQADSSSTRAHKGLGLGLTIVRRLTELHGGTVRAESGGEGEGTTIEILLPVASTSKSTPVISTIDPDRRLEKEAKVSAKAPHVLPGLRVVVVDDDPAARELVATVLAHSGIEVDAVSSAAEGLSAIERLKPDVVVSDIEMPEEDGYMFIQEVRALDAEHGGRTPAVALTAYTRAEDRSRSLAAGFQMHLGKPIEADELVNAIVSLSNQRQKGPSHAQITRH